MYIERKIEQELEKSLTNNKILFLLGARQVGKTTLIEHVLDKHRGSSLNMDIATNRAYFLSAANLSPTEALRFLGAKDILVIDEAHRIPDIGRTTKGWYDSHISTKIILLGSSSFALLNNAAAELVGRNEKIWLTPLLFTEILSKQDWYSSRLPSKIIQQDFHHQIQSLLLKHLVYGSYPEAYLTDDPRQYLTSLTNDYLLKDILNSASIRDPESIRRLLLELAKSTGQEISTLALANRLNLSRPSCQRYLDLLEHAFIIFNLPAFSTNPIKETTSTHQYYFWDTGVKNALQNEWVISSSRSDIDALWKNWIMSEIFKLSRTERRLEDLFFWRSRHGSSVDLVVKQGSKLHAFDFRFNPRDARPSRAFKNAYNITPQTIHPENFLEFLI